MRLPEWNDRGRRVAELLTAARFFTRLPLGAGAPPEPGGLSRAAWAFPVIGAVLGMLCGLVYWIADGLAFPATVAGLVAVGFGVLATGALHEDGLADTADGLGGGADREARLAIMRDSRSGAFGVLAIVFSVGLRAAAIASIAEPGAILAALVAAHAVGRGGLAPVLQLLGPARLDGLGASAGEPSMGEAGWSAGIAAVIALFALGLRGGIAGLVLAALVMAAVAALAQRRIGGHTGDVLGAIEQGGEIAMLLAAAAWAT